MNGFGIGANAAAKFATFVALAEGRLDEEALARWIRDHLGPASET